MSEETHETAVSACETSGPKDRKNRSRMLVTTLVWCLTFVGATRLIENEVLEAGPLLWILAAVPGLMGFAVVFVYGRFLRETDELERLVQLQALALAFGGGLFAIYAYYMFQKLGAPALELPGATIFLIGLYIVGVFVGRRRYR